MALLAGSGLLRGCEVKVLNIGLLINHCHRPLVMYGATVLLLLMVSN